MVRDSAARPRTLPYDLAFTAEFERVHFPAMQAEAARLGVDTGDPERLLQMPTAGIVLRTALVQNEVPEVEQFGPLLFHAYQYWRSGKIVYDLDEEAMRHLLGEDLMLGRWSLVAPSPAGYLRVPRNILWAKIQEDATPEAVDGLFWSLAGHRLDALLVLGMVPGRPGFSVAQVTGDVRDEPDGHWGNLRAREVQPDFANVLPGGELQGLHAIETVGEVLKLVARVFWYITLQPQAVQEVAPGHKRVAWHG
jgi:hypothetical protein